MGRPGWGWPPRNLSQSKPSPRAHSPKQSIYLYEKKTKNSKFPNTLRKKYPFFENYKRKYFFFLSEMIGGVFFVSCTTRHQRWLLRKIFFEKVMMTCEQPPTVYQLILVEALLSEEAARNKLDLQSGAKAKASICCRPPPHDPAGIRGHSPSN